MGATSVQDSKTGTVIIGQAKVFIGGLYSTLRPRRARCDGATPPAPPHHTQPTTRPIHSAPAANGPAAACARDSSSRACLTT